ncbi:ABC transporter permease subunit [Ruficoccus amylovorans]|uniref:ABC transporter permease subunit n=1 Tax=Ruficoccus amylovorans TaxID=1804625 RepID=A0A842HJS1_9BACT|nr:ABC transporter permease subunit [Ruficoccus amylovorans]MBC2596370.1 ABC transporter permease subunit [Ruficoccus amylovorans]
MSGSCHRILTIGRNTFLDAVRQKFFNALVILSVALIVSSRFFRQFDFGSGELKFIADFGLGAILLFGSILAVVATAQLFYSEIENRTALTILAKPVYRWEFLAGKFLGVFLLLLVFTALMSGILGVMLYWRESALMERFGDQFEDGHRLVSYGGLFGFAVLQWLKLGVLCAVTLFVSSFSNTNLYSVVVSFFVMIICQLQYIARDSWENIGNPVLKGLVWALSLLFPNFQMFNVGDVMLFPHDATEQLGAFTPWAIGGYGLVYIVVFIGLAVYAFRRREI